MKTRAWSLSATTILNSTTRPTWITLIEAMERLDVPYPVAQDNEGQTWRAYKNRYWPSLYLIDKWGRIRYTHIGEGAYQETEAAIQALLAEPYN